MFKKYSIFELAVSVVAILVAAYAVIQNDTSMPPTAKAPEKAMGEVELTPEVPNTTAVEGVYGIELVEDTGYSMHWKTTPTEPGYTGLAGPIVACERRMNEAGKSRTGGAVDVKEFDGYLVIEIPYGRPPIRLGARTGSSIQ